MVTLQSVTTVTSLLTKYWQAQPKALIPTLPTKIASNTWVSMILVEPISSTTQTETWDKQLLTQALNHYLSVLTRKSQ
jgi:hypothetical protein